jgi:hypothetical protein
MHELLAFVGWDVEDGGQALHKLARGAQRALLDALDGHHCAVHLLGQLLLGQVARFAALLERVRECSGAIHARLL